MHSENVRPYALFALIGKTTVVVLWGTKRRTWLSHLLCERSYFGVKLWLPVYTHEVDYDAHVTMTENQILFGKVYVRQINSYWRGKATPTSSIREVSARVIWTAHASNNSGRVLLWCTYSSRWISPYDARGSCLWLVHGSYSTSRGITIRPRCCLASNVYPPFEVPNPDK